MCLQLIVNRLPQNSSRRRFTRLANTMMRCQVFAIRAKPVRRPGLRSHPPFISSDALLFSSQMPSSPVPGIAKSASGTLVRPPLSNPLTNFPSASTLWTPSATASSSLSLAASFAFSMFGRWTLLNKRTRVVRRCLAPVVKREAMGEGKEAKGEKREARGCEKCGRKIDKSNAWLTVTGEQSREITGPH